MYVLHDFTRSWKCLGSTTVSWKWYFFNTLTSFMWMRWRNKVYAIILFEVWTRRHANTYTYVVMFLYFLCFYFQMHINPGASEAVIMSLGQSSQPYKTCQFILGEFTRMTNKPFVLYQWYWSFKCLRVDTWERVCKRLIHLSADLCIYI